MSLDWNSVWREVGGPQILVHAATVTFRLIVIVVAAHVAIRFLVAVADRTFILTRRAARDDEAAIRRGETLRALVHSVIRYAIDFIALLTILPLFQVETAQLLASAGILGLAVGFGAQNLVRDVIAGFFILYENQFTVGEYVEVGDLSGIVQDLGLRVTTLRDFGGQIHIIPNGMIDKVTNHSRGDMRVLVEVAVAYEADTDRAIQELERVCSQMAQECPDLTQGPKVLGVHDLADSGVVLLVWAMAQPMQQWATARELRLRIKKAFDRAGIEIPYPRRVVIPLAGPTRSPAEKLRPEDESGGPMST